MKKPLISHGHFQTLRELLFFGLPFIGLTKMIADNSLCLAMGFNFLVSVILVQSINE